MKKLILSLAVLLALAAGNASFAANQPRPEVVARAVSEHWLALVDDAKSEESYLDLSPTFRKEVGKRKWRHTITSLRKPLGKLASRKFKNAVYTKELPGAPDGEHVVVSFDTTFANRRAATETVIAILDADLVWRVTSYTVK